jgi:hypothetical protein
MKKILITFLIVLTSTTAFAALEFEKGSDVPEIHPRLLRRLLQQGKGTYEGAKIVISKDAVTPSRFQKKWDEKKLSGETVPSIGEAGAKVIFIKSF